VNIFNRRAFHPAQLWPILTAAAISGLVITTYQVSFGSLIFSGGLAPYLASGIGFCLMGVVIIASVEALLSGTPGLVAMPTVGSAVIAATLAANIVAAPGATPERLFPTVTAAITLGALLTGAAFLTLGRFGLGNLIRYIPHPVIGGFLAGTGWLVVSGAMKTMNGLPLSLANLGKFASPEALLRWLPGVIYGVAMLLIGRRYKHYLVTPLLILLAVALFYLALGLTGVSVARAIELGLLFKPFPPGVLWQPPPLGQLPQVDWGVIINQAGTYATLILISGITLLLYASGVEVSAGIELDLNRELRACGAGNLAAAFSASPPGYTIITMSVLSRRLGANSRLVGLLTAGICALVMSFGAPLIALFPKLVLGGVLTYLGLTFLVDWLYDGWRRLARPDYAIVVVILLTMSGFGLLPGLGVGIGLAAALFIVQYSRVPVVRHALSGRSYHSRVERSQPQAELLRRQGRGLLILELQSYVFFGTANRVYEQLKKRLQIGAGGESVEGDDLKVVMLDFRRVSGVDASAALSFVRLKRLLKERQIRLAFTHLSPAIERQLRRDVLTPADAGLWQVFPDLDRGVEWFEEQALQASLASAVEVQAQPGAVQAGQEQAGLALLFAALAQPALAASKEAADRQPAADSDATETALLDLLRYLERVELRAGQVLIRQGQPQQYLYFLDAGLLNVEYGTDEGLTMRLETAGPGTIVGELSLYLSAPASATVTAAQPGVAYRLAAGDLTKLESEAPRAAAALHRFLLQRVGRRLLHALETVDALVD
jgi:SulP family sulfate permease